jgi:transglutaminase-like putative cysteine protease
MMENYLEATRIIDWHNKTVIDLADSIGSKYQTKEAIAKASFEWVRDQVFHSYDYKMNPVTCSASDVLKNKTGYCFAKSHLLAALLRANGIPTGFCYQRLSINDRGSPFSLHGFNAVYLAEIGWYRIDARGNKVDVDAQFMPPQEKLAFRVRFTQEADFHNIFAEPLPIVVKSLQSQNSWDGMLENLPDLSPETWKDYELIPKLKES